MRVRDATSKRSAGGTATYDVLRLQNGQLSGALCLLYQLNGDEMMTKLRRLNNGGYSIQINGVQYLSAAES